MSNWHEAKSAPEQGKGSEGYGNDTAQVPSLGSREGVSSSEGYNNSTSQDGSAEPSTLVVKPSRAIVVIALDPGITTGIATGVIKNGRMEVGSAQYKWDVYDLYKYLCRHQPDHLIYERFDYRRHKHRDGLELYSRELIGVAKLFAAIHNDLVHNLNIYEQMPAEGVGGYYTDNVLKAEGVYKVGNPHANDAVRHLLQWFTFKSGYQFNTSGFAPA